MNLPQSATDFLDVFIGYNSKQNEYNGRSGATDHDRCAAENSGRSTARYLDLMMDCLVVGVLCLPELPASSSLPLLLLLPG